MARSVNALKDIVFVAHTGFQCIAHFPLQIAGEFLLDERQSNELDHAIWSMNCSGVFVTFRRFYFVALLQTAPETCLFVLFL